jgi:ribosomal protein S18 acetylase RimI-like enzyme
MRPAELKDIPALNILINSAYRGESSKQGWTTEESLLGGIRTSEESLIETIETKGTTILIDFIEKELVACVQLVEKKEVLYVGMLTVKPNLQNAGLGKKLLKAAENFASSKGISKLEMTVISDRVELISWYERHGYAKTGESRPFPMGDPRFGEPKKFLEFLVLEKSLSNANLV